MSFIAALTLLGASSQASAPAPPPKEYELRNASGMTVRFLDYGATITAIEAPDRAGKMANVVLGLKSPADYTVDNNNGFGVVVGRYAGRIANATFNLDGQEVKLKANLGAHALHGGGLPGLHQQVWSVRPFKEGEVDGAALTYVSPDGEQGFPGQLTVTVTYRLMPDNALRIDYQAMTTRPTVLNLTNHSYFNLAGQGSVEGHTMRIASEEWIEADAEGIPSGRLAAVAGTPLDFRSERRIGERIDVKAPMMGERGGYNHGWAFAGGRTSEPRPVIWLSDPKSGRTLMVETTDPSVQAYTGDYFDGQDKDAKGRAILPRYGIALETQGYADAPHHPNFPTTRLDPGQAFNATTIWRFGVER